MQQQHSLLKQFIPILHGHGGSLMVFSLYSIVDGLFVARGVGEYAMSAVNLAVPFINLLFSIAVFLPWVPPPSLPISWGQGNPQSANRLFSQNLVTLAVIGATISILVMVFTEPLPYYWVPTRTRWSIPSTIFMGWRPLLCAS